MDNLARIRTYLFFLKGNVSEVAILHLHLAVLHQDMSELI